MGTNRCITYWAALICSNVWAASDNTHSTALAIVWGAFSVLIFAIDMIASSKYKKPIAPT